MTDDNYMKVLVEEYERLQKAEIHKICFFELKVFDFLIQSLN